MEYFLIISAYFSGSIPYGLLFTKLFQGIDVRELGSGNIGATNVLRTGHKGIAAATLTCDILKGFIPVLLSSWLLSENSWIFFVAYAAILGHIFPFWLKFKGGKGVATALGVFWALSFPLGCFATVVWGIAAKFGKISSLSALCAFALSPFFASLFLSQELAFFCFSIALLIAWTHRSNIYRMMKKEETGIF